MLNARTPRAAAAINNDVEAIVGVEEVVSGHRFAPASGRPSPASRAAVLEIGFAAACAFQILLHVSGTNAPDPQLSIVSVVLHDMNEADHARLAHLEQDHLRVELLDVNTTPTAVRYARLRPLSCGGGFIVFIHVQPFYRSISGRERALFGNVALNVHSVVEDAYDFDRASWSDSVHQEVAATATVPRNMQRTKTRHDLVPGPGSHDIGTAGQFANRLNECVPIDTRLSGAKILRRPFENIRKVEFGSGTETDTPSPLGHKGSIPLSWR
jgi:hypothetical protein